MQNLLVVNGFLRKKYLLNGFIDKYKANLVAKDCTKKQNVDYFDTFSPITRISFLWFLNVLASIYNLFIHQIDVKTVFLNGDVEKRCIVTTWRLYSS